ncbi:acyltransferase family protein [Massilia sp. S19_KUP03_FR1]|uniref:acyltransferase family protein n=1 Tax=Massilia sp. S19_KUP03_FR1 TaxID=3025503 RepID=UPI002FCD8339
MHNTSAPPQRQYFLDWIRILAFFFLILYHVGMYYVSWDWHVKSPHASTAIEPFMMLSSPWRLGLLFMVSGVATATLFEKMRVAAFLRRRSARLLVPLLFGMFVVVPPQAYLEVVEKVAYQGSYLAFMRLYLTGYHGFCRLDDCLRMPTWNHLWFVPYLWSYTVAYAALACLPGRPLARLSALLGRSLTGWRVLVLPLVVLALARILLLSHFPATHDLVNDWYNHANYFTLFVIGALLAGQPAVWRAFDAQRFTALGLALTCWAVVVMYVALPENVLPGSIDAWRNAQRVVYALCQWGAIVAICGFGHRHLQFDSPARRYLTQAVFPLYIVHQTLIVVFAHSLKVVGMPPVIEGIVLVVLTFAASFGIFALVRRVPLLRACFGIQGPLRETQAISSQHGAFASMAR